MIILIAIRKMLSVSARAGIVDHLFKGVLAHNIIYYCHGTSSIGMIKAPYVDCPYNLKEPNASNIVAQLIEGIEDGIELHGSDLWYFPPDRAYTGTMTFMGRELEYQAYWSEREKSIWTPLPMVSNIGTNCYHPIMHYNKCRNVFVENQFDESQYFPCIGGIPENRDGLTTWANQMDHVSIRSFERV